MMRLVSRSRLFAPKHLQSIHLRHARKFCSKEPLPKIPIPENQNNTTEIPKPSSDQQPSSQPVLSDKIDSRVWPIALSTLIMGTGHASVIPILPLFVESLGLSTSDFGLIVSIMGAARLVTNIPVACLADIYGRRPLLIWGPIGTTISMVGHGISTTLTELLSWRVWTGISSSAQMAGGHLYLLDISTPSNRARTLAPMGIAWSAGATLGPAIGGFLADYFGNFQAPFFFVAGCTGVILLNNYYRLPETLPAEMCQKKTGPFTQILKEYTKEVFEQWKVLIRDKNIKAALTVHSIFWFTLAGSQWTLLPMLAIQNFAFSPASLGYLFCLIAVVNVFGSTPAAWWSDTRGRKAAIIPGAGVIMLAVGLLPFATTLPQFLSLVVLWGI